jgi:prevent-host-death family protein
MKAYAAKVEEDRRAKTWRTHPWFDESSRSASDTQASPRRHGANATRMATGATIRVVRVGGTNHKGSVAELKFAAAAVELGILVLAPMTEHGPYDLVLDLGGKLTRVQCKWGALQPDQRIISVRITRSRLSSHGYVIRPYEDHEIDAIGVYCAEIGECYLIPASLAASRRVMHLRLGETRNGQRAALHFASDYRLGAVAQLGERSAGSRKVVGSNPISSTPSSPPESEAAVVGAHEFRNRFGWYMERAAGGEELLITRRGVPHARLGPPEPPPSPLAGAPKRRDR